MYLLICTLYTYRSYLKSKNIHRPVESELYFIMRLFDDSSLCESNQSFILRTDNNKISLWEAHLIHSTKPEKPYIAQVLNSDTWWHAGMAYRFSQYIGTFWNVCYWYR